MLIQENMDNEIDCLMGLAYKIRKDVLSMTYESGANGGHLGGALSSADILAVLYGSVLNVDINDMTFAGRDRFLLSKGHIALAHYAVLAECGIISRQDLKDFEVPGGDYPTHENMMLEKGIEISGGSLGYGLSMGVGCALTAKLNQQFHKIYVLLGDGECNEGIVWEAFMSAVQYKLDNLLCIIDINGQQLDGYSEDIMQIRSFETVLKGFGCNCISVDGHNIRELQSAMKSGAIDKPTVVLARTVKGKGIRSIEKQANNHHVRLTEEQYIQYMAELEEAYDGLFSNEYK